jgi:pyruvate formate-lyase activating enzyme-like uncharacterized protein
MIKLLSIQEAYKRKIERQEGLKGLKFKCHGSCAYVGEDVSPGCYPCFYSDACTCGPILSWDIGLPEVCNRDCVYCFKPHPVQEHYSVPNEWKLAEEWKAGTIRYVMEEKQRIISDCKMQYYNFTGICEPLLYFPVLEAMMNFFRNVIDPLMDVKGWAKIYTNGTLLNRENILKLKDLGFDEVRVHPGATNFSKEVYDNMRLAARYIPTVTVETPSWPPHRGKLFEMLPVLEDIGVKHLDICQVEIFSKKQLEKIENALGETELYQAYYPMLDDGGLVEDILKEVLEKGYTYSVIDCNGFVKQSMMSVGRFQSYWSVLNQKYPPEWEKHRYGRKLSRNVDVS